MRLLGLAVLLVALVGLIAPLQPHAAAATVSQVSVVNLTDHDFWVAWQTDQPTSGSILYGRTCATATTPGTKAEEPVDGYVHLVDLGGGLDADTSYSYKVVNNGTPDDNNGQCYTAHTFAQFPTPGVPTTIFGFVKAPASCQTPTPGVLVTVTVTHGGTTSLPMARTTSGSGGWSIPIGVATDASGHFINPATGDALTINAVAANGNSATVTDTFNPPATSPQHVKDVCLPASLAASGTSSSPTATRVPVVTATATSASGTPVSTATATAASTTPQASATATATAASLPTSAAGTATAVVRPSVTPTSTSTSAAGPTNTAVATRSPTIAAASTPAATSTPQASPTSTQQVSKQPSIVIESVSIVRTKDSTGSDTQMVRAGEPVDFRVEYRRMNSAGLVPSATLSITHNGNPIATAKMSRARHEDHPAFHALLTFKNLDVSSKLYAHFRLTMGPASAKRDRRFAILPAGAPFPTSTPVVSPTPTSTAVGGKQPSIVIESVKIVRVSDRAGADTQLLHVGEAADFRVTYRRANSAGLVPSGTLGITRNGASIATVKMARARYDNRPAFHAVLRFNSAAVGSKLYAHFQLKLGPARAKRDRRFVVLSALNAR